MNTLWHNLSIDEVFKELHSSANGLEEKEAKKRLKKYGPNSLPREKIFSRFSILLSQFESPLIYILVFAGVLSGIFGQPADMAIIFVTVASSIAIGFVQEDKANKSLSELKKIVEHQARVTRGGKEKIISAENLAPGDVVTIEEGGRVPADGRLIFTRDLEVSEAGLTGESLPVSKEIKSIGQNVVLAERKNMVYMGTLVTRGRGIFVVTFTGLKTHFGEIAVLVRETEEERTPLQARMVRFGRILGLFIVTIASLLFSIGIVKGFSFVEMFLTSVALVVSAIPEGLPIAITVILAVGMQRMSREKALTRRMAAAEALGTVSVICTDKTGTLTLGEMRAAHLISFHGDLLNVSRDKMSAGQNGTLETASIISLLCNNAIVENPKDELRDWVVFGDPTEKALLLKGYEMGFSKEKFEKEMPRLDEILFSTERKYMATLNKKGSNGIIMVKGAPEVIFKKSSKILRHNEEIKFDPEIKAKMKARLDEMTGRGLRVLALAYKEIKKTDKIEEKDIEDLVVVGLVGLKDPLRETSKDTVLLAKKAGVRTVIVTGDHILTAKAIGKELGLRTADENVLEGKDLDAMSEADLADKIKDIDVFARVMPKHKLRIVAAWQDRGEVVAMTGDGINDAPAIKSADIGIALGSGSDVAKETSDMVLLDDNFKTIVRAIERGRIIFDNIRKVIIYLLSSSFIEIILVAGCVIMGLPLPVTAAQILWANLAEHSMPALALAVDDGEGDVMRKIPRHRKTPILNSQMKMIMITASIFVDVFLFFLFSFILNKTNNLELARTATFIGMAVHSLFTIFAYRSLRKNLWQTAFWKNYYLNLSFVAGLALLALVIYVPFMQKIFKTVPLGWGVLCVLFVLGMANLFVIEAVKWFYIRKNKVD